MMNFDKTFAKYYLPFLSLYSLFLTAVAVSFQQRHLTVKEDVGTIVIALNSTGLYNSKFTVSFTCVEVHPVEANSEWYNQYIVFNIMV